MVPVAGGGTRGPSGWSWGGAGAAPRARPPAPPNKRIKSKKKIVSWVFAVCSVLLFHSFLTDTSPRSGGTRQGRGIYRIATTLRVFKTNKQKKNLFHCFWRFCFVFSATFISAGFQPGTRSTGPGTTHLHLAFGRGSRSLRPGQGWGGGGEGTGRGCWTGWGNIFLKKKKFQIACSSGTATTKKHQPDSHRR